MVHDPDIFDESKFGKVRPQLLLVRVEGEIANEHVPGWHWITILIILRAGGGRGWSIAITILGLDLRLGVSLFVLDLGIHDLGIHDLSLEGFAIHHERDEKGADVVDGVEVGQGEQVAKVFVL